MVSPKDNRNVGRVWNVCRLTAIVNWNKLMTTMVFPTNDYKEYLSFTKQEASLSSLQWPDSRVVNNQTHSDLSWALHALSMSPWTSQFLIAALTLFFIKYQYVHELSHLIFMLPQWSTCYHCISHLHTSSERLSNSPKFILLPSMSWDSNQVYKILKPKCLLLIILWHFPVIK